MRNYWADLDITIREEELLDSLDLFQRYVEYAESFLVGSEFQEARDSFRIRQQIILSALPLDERDWYEFVSLGYFVDILRRSLFVNLYSFLELWLLDECAYHQSRKNVQQTVRDVRGRNMMEKVRKYLIKVTQIDFPKTSEWIAICEDYRRLRNCITHNGGRVDKRLGIRNEKLLREFINKDIGLSIHEHSNTIVIHSNFCPDVLSSIRRFFEFYFGNLVKGE